MLCSSAVRTRETLDAILPVLGAPEVLIEDALYGASADALLSRICRRCPTRRSRCS